MSYINSKLQAGEQVVLRVNQGRKWYHFLFLFIQYCMVLPFLFWILMTFFVPIVGAFISEEAVLLGVLGFMGLISIGMFFNLIHFALDEVALTNTRVLGRAMGATVFGFKKIDVPLSAIQSIATGNFLAPEVTLQRKDGKPDLRLRSISPRKEFIARLSELIVRPV